MLKANLGDRKRGHELGYKQNSLHEYVECPRCGKQKWVQVRKGIPLSPYCVGCFQKVNGNKNYGEQTNAWKGGITTDKDGYKWIRLHPSHAYYSMAVHNGYVPEHRLVVAEYLGRNLSKNEIVHHINTIKDDNRVENLEITTRAEHARNHIGRYVKELESKVDRLEKQIGQMVYLSPDQSLPYTLNHTSWQYDTALSDMLKENWVKVMPK